MIFYVENNNDKIKMPINIVKFENFTRNGKAKKRVTVIQ